MTDELVSPGYSSGARLLCADPDQQPRSSPRPPRSSTRASAGIRGTGRGQRDLLSDQEYGRNLLQPPHRVERELRQDKTAGAGIKPLHQPHHGSYSQPVLFVHRGALRRRARYDGNRIPLVPKNKVVGEAFLCYFQLEFQPRFRVHGRPIRHKRPGERAGAVAWLHDFDASVGYRWNKLAALFTVKNLTDKSYSEVGVFSPFVNDIGLYPLPGRQFFLSLKYAFGEDQGSHPESMKAMKGR